MLAFVGTPHPGLALLAAHTGNVLVEHLAFLLRPTHELHVVRAQDPADELLDDRRLNAGAGEAACGDVAGGDDVVKHCFISLSLADRVVVRHPSQRARAHALAEQRAQPDRQLRVVPDALHQLHRLLRQARFLLCRDNLHALSVPVGEEVLGRGGIDDLRENVCRFVERAVALRAAIGVNVAVSPLLPSSLAILHQLRRGTGVEPEASGDILQRRLRVGQRDLVGLVVGAVRHGLQEHALLVR